MPTYEAELSDGSQIEFESDHEPTVEELESAARRFAPAATAPKSPEEPNAGPGWHTFSVTSALGLPMRVPLPENPLEGPVQLPTATVPPQTGDVTLSSPIGVPIRIPRQLAAEQGAAIYNVGLKPIVELPFSPAGAAMMVAPQSALARSIAQGTFSGLAAKGGAEALGEASVTGNSQQQLEGALMLGTAPLLAKPGTRPIPAKPQGPMATEAGIAMLLYGQARFPSQKVLPRATQAARQAINPQGSQPSTTAAQPPPLPGGPNAGQVTSPTGVSQPEIRPQLGQTAPLRQPGQTPEALGSEVQQPRLAQATQVPLIEQPSGVMNQALIDLGYNTRDRATMKPEDAQRIIAGAVRKPGTTRPAGQQAEAEMRRQPEAENIETTLDPEEQDYLESERQFIDRPVHIVNRLHDEPESPFAGNQRIATIRPDGSIELVPERYSRWLKKIPEKDRQEAVRALLGEESNHAVAQAVTTSEERAQFWRDMSGLEKALHTRIYTGEWSMGALERKHGIRFSDSQMGYEAMNSWQMRLHRMTRREAVEAALRERWTVKSLDTMAQIAFRMRRAMGTTASGTQNALLARLMDNVSAARIAVAGGEAPATFQKGIKIRHPDGSTEDGLFHGYWDLRGIGQGILPTISRRTSNGDWTTGMLHAGESIDGNIPTFEEWKAPKVAPAAFDKRGREVEDDLFRQILPPALGQTGPELPKAPAEGLFTGPKGQGKLTRPETAPALQVLAQAEAARYEPVTATGLENLATKHLLSTSRPSFGDFLSEARMRFGPEVEGPQVKDAMQDAIWNRLMTASGAELKAMVRSLNLAKNLHLDLPSGSERTIADPPASAKGPGVPVQRGFGIEGMGVTRPEAVEGEAARAGSTPAGERTAQNFRSNVIATIGNKLMQEVAEGKKAWHRSEISPEDIATAAYEGKESPWQEFNPSAANNPEQLGQQLVSGARSFGGAKLRRVVNGKVVEIKQPGIPVSVTRRLTSIQNKANGKVYLVSTFKDGRRGTVLLDPLSPGQTHVPLESILRRYRVLSSTLLNEPVQNFKQAYPSLRAFENDFASAGRQVGSPQIGDPSLLTGTAFRDPLSGLQGAHVATPGVFQAKPGVLESKTPITEPEARAIVEHIFEESATLEGPDDVLASLLALKEKRNFQALSGYRKLAKVIEEQSPQASSEETLEILLKLSQEIYGQSVKSTSFEDFISRLAQSGAQAGEAAPIGSPPAPVPGRVQAQIRQFPLPTGRAIPGVARIPWHGPETFPAKAGPPEMLPPGAPAGQLQPEPPKPKILQVNPYESLAKRAVPKERYTLGRGKALADVEAEIQAGQAGQKKGEVSESEKWNRKTDIEGLWPDTPESDAPGAFLKSLKETSQEELARGLAMTSAMITRSFTDRTISANRDAVDNISNNQGRRAENSIRGVTAKRTPGKVRQPAFRGDKDVLASANAILAAGAIKPHYIIDAAAQVELDKIALADPRTNLGRNMLVHPDPTIRSNGLRLLQKVNQDAIHSLIQQGLISTKGLSYSFDPNAIGNLNGFLAKVNQGISKARAAIQQTSNLVKRAQARKWLRAAEALQREVVYAQAHWKDVALQRTATRMKMELDTQYAVELEAGYNSRFDQDYLPGRYDAEFFNDGAVTFGGFRIFGRRFTSPKTFPTYYDAIQAGPYIPATRDGADIVGHRVRQGSRRVQFAGWVEGLTKIIDPVSNLPVAAKPKVGPTGPQAPNAEYDLMYLQKGRSPIAVRHGYKDLLEQLTGSSRVQEWAVTRSALELGQKLKHTLLLGDVFHLARLGYYGTSIMGTKLGHRKGLNAIEFRDADLDEAVRNGIVRPEEAAWSREQIPIRQGKKTSYLTRRQLVEEFERIGLNVGKIQDGIYKDLVAHIPVIGRYNKWLFDRFTRGLMMQSAVQSFERLNRSHPEVDARLLMRDVARDVNNYFGSIGRQGIFKSSTMQDLSRLAFLAPQWVEGLLMKEAGFAGRITGGSNLLGRRGLPQLGVMGSGIGSGLVAMLALTQVINLISRGKPTWENPEKGHKFDAWIPGTRNGFFFSPLAVYNELSHDLVRLSETKPKVWDAITQIGENKLSPWGRLAVVLKESREPGSGARITTTAGIASAAGKQFLPVPITVSSVGQAALSKTGLVKPPPPGSVQRQLLASFAGLKVEPARSYAQEIGDKAHEWVKQAGLDKVTGWMQVPTDDPSYSKLRSAIRNGDERGAKVMLAALRQTHSVKEIISAMKASAKRPFTGTKRSERAFLYTLGDEDLALYSRAQEERQRDYEAFISFLLRQ